MSITLDGQTLPAAMTAGLSLSDALTRIRGERCPDRVIVAVNLNGRPCTEEELEARLPLALPPDDEITLESADPRDISRDALRTLADEVAAGGKRQPEVAAQLNGGSSADGIRLIGELADVWSTCQRVLTQASGLLGRDLTLMEHAGRPVRAHIDDLSAQLRELRDALDSRDLVLLADLAHYEMPPLHERWHGLLSDLAEQIATGE